MSKCGGKPEFCSNSGRCLYDNYDMYVPCERGETAVSFSSCIECITTHEPEQDRNNVWCMQKVYMYYAPLSFCVDNETYCTHDLKGHVAKSLTECITISNNYEPRPDDCNKNGLSDIIDLNLNICEDIDQEYRCDECQFDCNKNGIPDYYEIIYKLNGAKDENNDTIIDSCIIEDCNGNTVYDATDISSGTSKDLNKNGVPDECEPDCNGDGIPDFIDLMYEQDTDHNGNGVPDKCEPDCNSNGFPDEMDIKSNTSKDENNNGTPDECDQDCNKNGIPDDLDISRGTSQDSDGDGLPDECDVDCNDNGIPDYIDISGGTSTDIDGDGVPDECQEDCDHNGIPDAHELIADPLKDINRNGKLDKCELDCNHNNISDDIDIRLGISRDDNNDGIPDDCQFEDCNGNGVPDTLEIQNRYVNDCNNNHKPDECDIDSGASHDANYNGIPDECDLCLEDHTCGEGGYCDFFRGACRCFPGYFGSYCEQRDLCYSVDCGVNGRCIDGICFCNTNYTGQYCESFDCGEYGFYMISENACYCVRGWIGYRCSQCEMEYVQEVENPDYNPNEAKKVISSSSISSVRKDRMEARQQQPTINVTMVYMCCPGESRYIRFPVEKTSISSFMASSSFDHPCVFPNSTIPLSPDTNQRVYIDCSCVVHLLEEGYGQQERSSSSIINSKSSHSRNRNTARNSDGNDRRTMGIKSHAETEWYFNELEYFGNMMSEQDDSNEFGYILKKQHQRYMNSVSSARNSAISSTTRTNVAGVVLFAIVITVVSLVVVSIVIVMVIKMYKRYKARTQRTNPTPPQQQRKQNIISSPYITSNNNNINNTTSPIPMYRNVQNH